MRHYFTLLTLFFSFYLSSSQELHEVTVSINTSTCVSLSNSHKEKEPFLLYPNPVQDLLMIESVYNQIDLVLYDSAGRVLKKETLQEDDFTINLSSLAKGIYYVTVSHENKLKQSTIIIQ